jgi:hypothetical protein
LVLFFKKELLSSFFWQQEMNSSVRSNPVWYAAAGLMVFVCTWMSEQGAPVVLRHAVIPLVLIAAALLFAPRLQFAGAACMKAAPALPALVMFLMLIGIGGMANHGAKFAAMSYDFWHADLLMAPDRRPVLPAIAYILPPFPFPYAIVWYAGFCALFLVAWGYLREQGLAPLEQFSLLTASILAYLLIIPGYTELITFLVALLCWRAELTTAEKCVAVAIMIGGHEVAGAFAIAFLAIEAAPADRRAWMGVAIYLYFIYIVGFILAAGGGLGHDLVAATRPAAAHPETAWQLDVAHPWRCIVGILAAYKLFWLILPAAFRVPRVRLHAACVALALPLVFVAVDTSRIVQFGSLSLFALVAGVWPRLHPRLRQSLTIGTLLLPSICEGTKAMPAWGKGLYAIYLFTAQRFGFTLGGMAF